MNASAKEILRFRISSFLSSFVAPHHSDHKLLLAKRAVGVLFLFSAERREA